MNHLTEEQLVLHHFGDLDDETEAASIAGHLHECRACQAELDGLRQTLSAASQLVVPDPGDGYGAHVWARIQPSLGQAGSGWRVRLAALFAPRQPASPKPGWILAGRRWAWAGAAAALFVVAFVAGRQVANRQPVPVAVPSQASQVARTSQPPATAGDAASAPATAPADAPPTVTATPASAAARAAAERERVQAGVLLVAVGDHLERSEVALSELMNSPREPEMDLSEERRRARDLVAENRLYRQTALAAGQPAVASMLDDLERVLVEVANGPSKVDEAEFDRVRRRLDQQDILFKVRVFGERVREAEDRPTVRSGLRG